MEATVAERLRQVKQDIEEVAGRAGREGEVNLVAVSKTVPAGRVAEAYEAGQRLFGENRVQEGLHKIEEVAPTMPAAEWHLIGHLQSNKARRAAEAFAMIQSVDSLALARKLDDVALPHAPVSVLLEVNVAGEVSKFGFSPQALEDCMDLLLSLRGLELRGLMTVAPLTGHPEQVRPVFRGLRTMRDRIALQHDLPAFDQLSMGMSGDYKVAIEEGATMVRLGRAIFGDRAR
jgi:pyridoxal phosphate enzyme (YggS family)